jgi:hypothetical protein
LHDFGKKKINRISLQVDSLKSLNFDPMKKPGSFRASPRAESAVSSSTPTGVPSALNSPGPLSPSADPFAADTRKHLVWLCERFIGFHFADWFSARF